MEGRSKLYRRMYLPRAFTSESYFKLRRHELRYSHKKRSFPDIAGECDETVNSDYESQPPGLEIDLKDAALKEEGSTSASAVVPTVIKPKDEGVS